MEKSLCIFWKCQREFRNSSKRSLEHLFRPSPRWKDLEDWPDCLYDKRKASFHKRARCSEVSPKMMPKYNQKIITRMLFRKVLDEWNKILIKLRTSSVFVKDWELNRFLFCRKLKNWSLNFFSFFMLSQSILYLIGFSFLAFELGLEIGRRFPANAGTFLKLLIFLSTLSALKVNFLSKIFFLRLFFHEKTFLEFFFHGIFSVKFVL